MNRTANLRYQAFAGNVTVRMSLVLVTAFATLGLADRASAVPMVSDANLLSGLLPNVSSTFNANYSADNSTDGEASGEQKDFVFDGGDSDQRMAFNGFTSGVSIVRVWSTDLRPLQLLLKSSATDQTSLNSADYETTLFSGPITQAMWSNQSGPSIVPSYLELLTYAPVGTKSLYLDFDSGNDTTSNAGFSRIAEVQAFYISPPPAPEPSSLVLAGLGLVAISTRRKRKA